MENGKKNYATSIDEMLKRPMPPGHRGTMEDDRSEQRKRDREERARQKMEAEKPVEVVPLFSALKRLPMPNAGDSALDHKIIQTLGEFDKARHFLEDRRMIGITTTSAMLCGGGGGNGGGDSSIGGNSIPMMGGGTRQQPSAYPCGGAGPPQPQHQHNRHPFVKTMDNKVNYNNGRSGRSSSGYPIAKQTPSMMMNGAQQRFQQQQQLHQQHNGRSALPQPPSSSGSFVKPSALMHQFASSSANVSSSSSSSAGNMMQPPSVENILKMFKSKVVKPLSPIEATPRVELSEQHSATAHKYAGFVSLGGGFLSRPIVAPMMDDLPAEPEPKPLLPEPVIMTQATLPAAGDWLKDLDLSEDSDDQDAPQPIPVNVLDMDSATVPLQQPVEMAALKSAHVRMLSPSNDNSSESENNKWSLDSFLADPAAGKPQPQQPVSVPVAATSTAVPIRSISAYNDAIDIVLAQSKRLAAIKVISSMSEDTDEAIVQPPVSPLKVRLTKKRRTKEKKHQQLHAGADSSDDEGFGSNNTAQSGRSGSETMLQQSGKGPDGKKISRGRSRKSNKYAASEATATASASSSSKSTSSKSSESAARKEAKKLAAAAAAADPAIDGVESSGGGSGGFAHSSRTHVAPVVISDDDDDDTDKMVKYDKNKNVTLRRLFMISKSRGGKGGAKVKGQIVIIDHSAEQQQLQQQQQQRHEQQPLRQQQSNKDTPMPTASPSSTVAATTSNTTTATTTITITPPKRTPSSKMLHQSPTAQPPLSVAYATGLVTVSKTALQQINSNNQTSHNNINNNNGSSGGSSSEKSSHKTIAATDANSSSNVSNMNNNTTNITTDASTKVPTITSASLSLICRIDLSRLSRIPKRPSSPKTSAQMKHEMLGGSGPVAGSDTNDPMLGKQQITKIGAGAGAAMLSGAPKSSNEYEQAQRRKRSSIVSSSPYKKRKLHNELQPIESVCPNSAQAISSNPTNLLFEAQNLKNAADAMKVHLMQAMKYLEAVLYFLLTGTALERSAKEDKAFTMFSETLNLIKSVSSKLVSKQNFDTAQGTPHTKVLILSLRCQSLILLKLYKMRRNEVRDCQRAIGDYMVNSIPKMTDGKTSSPLSPPNSVCSQSSGSATPPCQLVPTQMHGAFQRQTEFFNYLSNSHELWEQADTLVYRDHHTDFFDALDREYGPITLHSTLPTVVTYVKAGLQKLEHIVIGARRAQQPQHQQQHQQKTHTKLYPGPYSRYV